MTGQQNGRCARTCAAAIAAASVVLVLGPVLVAAPADAAPLTWGTCPTSTSSVLSDLGTPAAVSVPDCVTPVGLGSGAAPAPAPVPALPAPVVQQPSTGDVTVTVPGAITDGTATSTASAAAGTRFGTLSLERSSNTVYPVKDGYRDTVRIAVRATDATGAAAALQGTVALSRGGRTLRTWAVDGAHEVITWDGRVAGAIHPGLYTITATAIEDGSALSSTTRVRVLSAHLQKHALVVRSDVGARSASADLPKWLLKAYAMGGVTVRLRTVARVSGPARLVFSSPGTTRALALRSGVHTTAPMQVPPGFDHVTITHDWAKGAARLRSLHAIWTYYTLS